MKIDNKPPVMLTLVKNDRAERQQKEKEPSAPPAVGDDSVAISQALQQADTLNGVARDLPETRTEKVDDLKARIDSGDYDVPGKLVAEKMIARILRDKQSQQDE